MFMVINREPTTGFIGKEGGYHTQIATIKETGDTQKKKYRSNQIKANTKELQKEKAKEVEKEIKVGMERDGPPANDCCSICHGNFNIPCQANCSHWFCGQCILRLWDYGSALQPCRCPLCRSPINLLIPSEASLRQRNDPEVANIISRLESYNRLYGERSSSLIQRLRDLPFLLRRLIRDMLDPQRSLPLVIKARVYLAVLLSAIYLLSPVDIIPEGILGIIGLLDDAIMLLICLLHVAAIYRSVLVYRHGGS